MSSTRKWTPTVRLTVIFPPETEDFVLISSTSMTDAKEPPRIFGSALRYELMSQ
jgi:hypothetical protein